MVRLEPGAEAVAALRVGLPAGADRTAAVEVTAAGGTFATTVTVPVMPLRVSPGGPLAAMDGRALDFSLDSAGDVVNANDVDPSRLTFRSQGPAGRGGVTPASAGVGCKRPRHVS